jgi:copper chaperone CopZ
MRPVSALPLLCLALLSIAIGACGSAVSTGSFKGEEHAVAQAISDLQSNVSALDQAKVCSDDLSSALVARLDVAAGGCKKALETQMKEIDSFEAKVESVQINGSTATARVKSVYEGKQRIATLTLVKEDGKWKISGVA